MLPYLDLRVSLKVVLSRARDIESSTSSVQAAVTKNIAHRSDVQHSLLDGGSTVNGSDPQDQSPYINSNGYNE